MLILLVFLQKPGEGPASAPAVPSESPSAMEIYSEIDNQQEGGSSTAASARPASRMSVKEELYAEIDSLEPSSSSTARAGASLNTQLADPGYEKVDLTVSKGEQTDSAGYAIVKESAGARAASSNTTAAAAANDDEEDYAECDPVPGAGVERISPSDLNHHLLRHGSDVSDYATVADTRAPSSVEQQQPQSPPINNSDRPFQKYVKKEHLYQEIDVVRDDKNPPDKEE